MENKYRVTVAAKKSSGDKDLAQSLVIYLPAALCRDANLSIGDKFEARVINNKCAIRQSDDGDLTLNSNTCLYVPANRFQPPIKSIAAQEINYTLSNEWLAFQIPKEWEYIAKGFDLVEDENARPKGFGTVESL